MAKDKTKLGKKTGIAGILLASLGFGGGTAMEATKPTSAQQELIELQEEVQERYEDTIESLETAVTKVGSVVRSGRVITQRIRDDVTDTVDEAKERAITAVASVSAEAEKVRNDFLSEAKNSVQRMIATVASGVAGIIGTVFAALGFRKEEKE